jgi:hypothetical protein
MFNAWKQFAGEPDSDGDHETSAFNIGSQALQLNQERAGRPGPGQSRQRA